MKRTNHTTEQIIEKLRQADMALGKGQEAPEVCKTLGITEQTYYRWRQKYGDTAPDLAKQLRARSIWEMSATEIGQPNC